MTKSNHTPGPWKIDRSGDIVTETGKLIAENPLLDAKSITISAAHERTKNANLIASAPELLAALEKTRTELNHWHEWRLQTSTTGYETSSGAEHCAKILNDAASAIAKAKGVQS